ncbi:MAG: putative ABC transporter C family member 5 [Streblomastix strix]|uniref:Putative ABC transporter C family member 5 n=1 Tax=Streblomastix strix TaxID=222440 RepID=A0A5J4WQF6_9EUKA|nr:MAG: putative ABC transporter C family member 5 [Streblomastix strix]
MKEQKRLANREEQHFWLANAFYCFYFPLVCRRKPVTNDDVYECHTVDKCELKVKHSTDYWDKHVNKYMKAMNEWKQKQSENPGKKIKQPRKPFMLWMLLFGVGTRLLLLGQLLFFSSTILIVVQPLLMRELLKAVNNKQTNPYTSFPYASAIFIALFQFLSQLFLGWAQSAMCGMIYNKTLKLNITSQSNVDTGKLLSLISVDVQNIGTQVWVLLHCLHIPISILIPLIFVFYDIGATTLIALAVILLVMIPIIYFSSKMAKSIKKYLGSNDIRNKITNETIQGIRVVKYSGLENIFINRIKQTRLPQCWNSFHYTFHVQCVAAFTRCIDPLINAATIPTYTFTKNIQQSDFPLDVMPNLSFINQMARECRFIPQYIQGILMIVVGLQRIQEFLFLPEISREIHEQPNDSENVALIIENGFFGWGDPIKIPLTVAEKSKMKKEMEKRRKQQKIEENKNKDNKDINDGNNGLQYNGMESEHEKQLISQLTQNQNLISSKTDSPQQEVFSSNKQNNSSFPEPIVSPFEIPSPSISSSPSQINNQIPINESSNQEDLKQEQNKKKKKIHLQDINMKLKKGSLTMIIGGVGSGKSSLGSAIIGDIERQSGEIKSIGTIAYCPQTPWINNNTVQGNIIFGNQYDEQKYNEIVRICALEPDFQTLPAGDQTAIGEKGVNLSGGQKARIQLARAVYSDRDIYILDDPLSAVDAHVGRHLFEECIDGRLKMKTRLLMTNQLQFLERADNIILIKGGRILKAPSSFFDTTPMGRILNRLTGDLTMHASRQLQRIESISKSPIFSLYSETVSGAGLSTIRAFKLEDTWRKKFFNLCDQWAIRFELYMLGNPWVQLYCSIASALMMLSVVILGWFYMSPAVLSVAIMASLSFQHLGGNLIQQSTFLKSQMTSFGRILFYTTKLPQEIRRSIDSVKVKKNWPKSGKIQFDNVSFRYRSGLPYVLNNVNFTFKGGEKIGVCGRTGAGKSSLLFPLFRLIELDPKLQPTMIDVNTGFPIEPDPNEEPNKGRILIDGIDISKVYLSRVRRSIAIIPQDPTLFTGTLRYNLDIANKCNDDRIWEVLQMVEMRDVIINLPLGLDTQVAEGGSNFSTGQRQLICFGRAILNNCRIVVMDEATASVDVETDAKIQRTIREQFVDKTVIVIAHRLNTIMNSDRIMVMSDGRVAEIDKPKNLLADENSALNKLVKSLQH